MRERGVNVGDPNANFIIATTIMRPNGNGGQYTWLTSATERLERVLFSATLFLDPKIN